MRALKFRRSRLLFTRIFDFAFVGSRPASHPFSGNLAIRCELKKRQCVLKRRLGRDFLPDWPLPFCGTEEEGDIAEQSGKNPLPRDLKSKRT
ncbi:hypothetical protein AVEN_158091-1 [Araneus ventricosus]|uniref:Uncharacterized protein n=1 Tax=Araneus ventricosus TaxID=182803 RepID=A0A4Y2HSY4_ARAVE|nr:hypothetical protein AVEN_158091-1 [Araneus ventricosus]